MPTVDGAEINVEVMRPADNPDAPVVLTYSPYNTPEAIVPIVGISRWYGYLRRRRALLPQLRARPTGSRCSTASSSARSRTWRTASRPSRPYSTEGRSARERSTGFSAEASWPPPGVQQTSLGLGQGEATFTDLATSTEERSTRMPEAQTDWFFFKGEPLASDVRMTGSARLDLTLRLDRDHGHLTPILVDAAPDGTTKTVSRGFLNLLCRNGLARSQAVPENEPIEARVRFKPQDQLFRAGHRIGVLVQASNTVWAVPDDPGATYTLDLDRSRLLLPLLG